MFYKTYLVKNLCSKSCLVYLLQFIKINILKTQKNSKKKKFLLSGT